jgi:hypothetical protein
MRIGRSMSVFLVAAGLPLAGAAEVDDSIATYRALYAVEYKGKPLGMSEFAVNYDAARDVYRFESRTTAKGLLKLMTPNPIVESSEFRVEAGTIVPIDFAYEDGSRKGDDNVKIEFDWGKNSAVVTSDDGRRELSVAPGALDRGSLQVALMRDLATTGAPGSYLLADEDSVKPYAYTASGEETVKTGIGELQTLVLVQQRESSTRMTRLYVAKELRYLPVRIEQHRDGELQTAFLLESVNGIEHAQTSR